MKPGNVRRDLIKYLGKWASTLKAMVIRAPYLPAGCADAIPRFGDLPTAMPNEVLDHYYKEYPAYFMSLVGHSLEAPWSQVWHLVCAD